jgi:hypothetical protein
VNVEEIDRPDVFVALEKALPVLRTLAIPGSSFIPILWFLGLLSGQARVGLRYRNKGQTIFFRGQAEMSTSITPDSIFEELEDSG